MQVNFKIISNKNKNIYIEGYIEKEEFEEINYDDIDWYFWNGNGYQSNIFCHYDNVFKLTEKQSYEIDEFKNNYLEDALFIDNYIMESGEYENETVMREKVTLIINDGAKMETKIIESENTYLNYIVELKPRFNNQYLNDLILFMDEKNIEFNLFGDNDENYFIEKGKLYYELPKTFWDDDEEYKKEIINLINEEFIYICAEYFVYELGIYAKYGKLIEEFVEITYNTSNERLFELSQVTDETLEEFLIDNDIID